MELLPGLLILLAVLSLPLWTSVFPHHAAEYEAEYEYDLHIAQGAL